MKDAKHMKEDLEVALRFGRTLGTPVFIVDSNGDLLFYNEPAEKVLGRKFRDTGPMSASTWSRIFFPSDESGNPLLPESLPLMISLTENRPAFDTFWIRGIDNVLRHIAVAALPISGGAGKSIGCMAFFWETPEQ